MSSILKSFAKNHLGMCLEVSVEYMTWLKGISVSIRDMNTNTPEILQVRGRRSPYKLIFHKLPGQESFWELEKELFYHIPISGTGQLYPDLREAGSLSPRYLPFPVHNVAAG